MAKPDIHIEYFIHDVAKIWQVLYAAFPIKRALYIDEICGERQVDEYGLLSTRDQQCLSALIWLEEENWIRYLHIIPHEGVESAVLTTQAYQRLHNYHIDSSYLNIDRIRDAYQQKNSEQLKSVVHQLLVS